MGLDARKPVFGGFANNKGADPPAQTDQRLCYLLLESVISKLATGEISIL